MVAPLPVAIGVRPVEMDPALVNSVGLHHSLSTAVADLVDNSLDAGADRILVRFLVEGSQPVGLQIIDNGKGMDSIAVDDALTYAGRRDYRDGDLGHFGLGLKAASLSQADVLLVYSKAYGAAPIGRRLNRTGDQTPPEVGSLQAGVSEAAWQRIDVSFPIETGTIIEWRKARTFPTSTDDDESTRWLELSIGSVRDHLGVVLHRMLEAAKVSISIDVYDTGSGFGGAPRGVKPINPFGYQVSGHQDYPQQLVIELPDRSQPVIAQAHLWPARAQSPEFRIGGVPGVEHQGFFLYRNDRLLQVGGWSGVVGDRPEWELARVVLDLSPESSRHVTINPEKSGLQFSADLARALESSISVITGDTFRQYLDLAAGEDRKSRTRTRRPVTVVQPRLGLPADVLAAYRSTVEFDAATPPIDFRWTVLPLDQLFEINRELGYLKLNLRYRTQLVGRRSTDPEDAPVLKVLLHLLLARYFEGSFQGSKERAELAAWEQILMTAVRHQTKTGDL